MTTGHANRDRFERLMELLADRATEGLTEAQARELDGLLASADRADAEALDIVAAATMLGIHGSEAEAMPASLRARVEAEALARLAPGPREAGGLAQPGARGGEGAAARRMRLPVFAGWAAAAAAAALAVVGWWPRGGAGAPDPASLHRELAAREGVIRAAWTDPATGAAAPGEVVWDPGTQTGVMRFASSLPVNDPGTEVYQLWIFDGTRDDRYPVNGGIFSIPAGAAGAEVLVPIAPGIEVREAAMFAITVEKPGGVWVSDRSRLPLLAKVGAKAGG